MGIIICIPLIQFRNCCLHCRWYICSRRNTKSK